MDRIQAQITTVEQRIAANEANIEQWTEEFHEVVVKSAHNQHKKALIVKKISRERKSLVLSQGQLAQLEDTLLSLQAGEIAVDRRDTQQLIDAAAQLQRNASTDPAVNPYFYSRNEAKPEHAAVAHKRASMRARGKNPGPWTSSLDSHNMRSEEQEEGADPALIRDTAERAAAAHGQKKKGLRKKGKHSKMRKPRRTSRHTKSIRPSSRHHRRSLRRSLRR